MVIFHICTLSGSLHSIFISIISSNVLPTSLWLPGISIIQISQQGISSTVLFTNVVEFSYILLFSVDFTFLRLWLSSLILKNVSLFYWALCLTQSRQAIYTCWRFASHSLNLTSFLSGKPWACMGYSFSCRTFYVNEMAPDTTQRFFSTLFSLSLQLPICSFHFLKQGIVFFSPISVFTSHSLFTTTYPAFIKTFIIYIAEVLLI